MVKIIEVQGTPNPDAVKFITDARLVERGAKSFEDAGAARGDALAEAIFSSGPVASVFVLDRFVTVTKFPDAKWAELEPKLRSAIETRATPVAPAPPTAIGAAASDTDLLSKIEALIDENVRPALAGDGGGLDVLAYEAGVLTVHYQGACGSCPSSTAGTLFAIQNLLQRLVDPKIQVVSV